MLSFRMFLEKSQSPDYTFDRWAKTAEKLGSDVDSLVGQAKTTDAELDKKATKAKKEKQKPDEGSSDIEKEDAWMRLKQISKERLEKNKKSPDDTEKGSSDSSKK